MSTLSEVITEKTLRSLAGGRSYSRGEDYFESGLVGPVSEKNGVISAKVHGSHTYDSRLKIEAEGKGRFRLNHACTCPVGRDGDFCKHAVALGLAWIEKNEAVGEKPSSTSAASSKKDTTVTQQDIKKWLSVQDHKVIFEILLEQVKSDGDLRENLTLKIAKEQARGIDLSSYRSVIRNAFHISGYMRYDDVYGYSEDISETVDSIEKLFKEGFFSEVIALCEYAIEQAGSSLDSIDDSDGYIGGEIERLQELHLNACNKAKPEPLDLARRLFRFELEYGGYDIFYHPIDAYAKLLGATGLAEYRRCAEEEWAKIPAKGSTGNESSWDSKRSRITGIMESLAKAAGDIDGLIDIKKRDLTNSWKYLDIAEIYLKVKRHDEALEWAEKGLELFRERPDNRLRDFIAEEYHRRIRHDDALKLYRVQFAEDSDLEHYKKLAGYGKKIKRYESIREEALSLLRKDIEKEKNSSKTGYWHRKPDHSRLVEIFLWEKDTEAAWNEARSGGCRDSLWLEMAKLREKDHPGDAVPVYQRLVEPIIAQMKNPAYEEATKMIRHIRELMHGMGQKAEFAAYFAQVRLRHKPKRNLMKLLDGL
jgi:uncharacterized Zn finger protein